MSRPTLINVDLDAYTETTVSATSTRAAFREIEEHVLLWANPGAEVDEEERLSEIVTLIRKHGKTVTAFRLVYGGVGE